MGRDVGTAARVNLILRKKGARRPPPEPQRRPAQRADGTQSRDRLPFFLSLIALFVLVCPIAAVAVAAVAARTAADRRKLCRRRTVCTPNPPAQSFLSVHSFLSLIDPLDPLVLILHVA